MGMPQSSIAYAAARVYHRSRGVLNTARAERLLSAQSAEEAWQILSEMGLDGADEERNADTAAEERLHSAHRLICSISPKESTTDCFFLRYDGMNLKTLIKARMLGKTEGHLSRCGTFPIHVLRHAVAKRQYNALPATLSTELNALEKILAVQNDPFLIDITVDKAIYALVQEKLRKEKSAMVRGYFTARVDMVNAMMLLRAKGLGKDEAFVEKLMLPGGCVNWEKWKKCFQKTSDLPGVLVNYEEKVGTAAKNAVADISCLPLFEKAMEDALVKPFYALKDSVYCIESIIAYWLATEREAAAIRLILAAHENGFATGVIRERMGELYGK